MLENTLNGGVMETSLNRSQQSPIEQSGASGAPASDPTAVPEEKVSGEFDPRKNLNPDAQTKIQIENLNFYYGAKQALYDVALPIREHQVTALIGPSGCGKSTFLRTLNRMNDLIPGTRTEGVAQFGNENICAKTTDVVLLRQRIGMVFQRPNPFPKSIFDNVAYGLRVQGKSGKEVRAMVEQSLRGAALWDEVEDRLKTSALGLSGGQQQRLCIARALA